MSIDIRRPFWTGGVAVALAAAMLALSLRDTVTAQVPAVPSGSTSTRLADGRWLIVGGADASGPRATAAIYDPLSQTTTPLRQGLLNARAHHSATLLSDGTVLIVGGTGPNTKPLATAELFYPFSGSFLPASMRLISRRAGHTATLLTDGRVLIVGGTAG